MLKLLLFVAASHVLVTAQDCWQTGCQPNDWAVKGCAQYGRDERGRNSCRDGRGVAGFKYNCCPKGGSGGGGGAAQRGTCSWYGANGEIPPGSWTACGQIFDRNALRAASRTLPCGTRVRVTNADYTSNRGRSVVVVINDRMTHPGRILDLTYNAFGSIENRNKGLVQCDVQVI